VGSHATRRTGLDRIAIAVPARPDLDAWAAWLDHVGVPHAGVQDATDSVNYSVLIFRDPDNVQLELFFIET
jgi:catechol-2,3-dioxygenase